MALATMWVLMVGGEAEVGAQGGEAEAEGDEGAGGHGEAGGRPGDGGGLGMSGDTLSAVEAHALLWARERLRTTVVAGPFLPQSEWRALGRAARRLEGLVSSGHSRGCCLAGHARARA